jgi:hypothetical protein
VSYATEFTGEPGEAAPRGFRWWRVSPDGELYSAWFDNAWDPSSNEAACALPVSRVSRRAWTKRHAGGVPAPGCSCGFYALHRVPEQAGVDTDPERPWLLDPEGWSGLGAQVVFGVAEAWGRVLIGTEGWRSRYSRAIALYVPQGSELWSSDRLRLVTERYGIPITASLESLAIEWAPEPIDGRWQRELQLVTADPDTPGGGDRLTWTAGATPTRVERAERAERPERHRKHDRDEPKDRGPGHWPGSWSGNSPVPRQPAPAAVPDAAARTARQVAAVERMAGPGSKRILELGVGAGYRASPLADNGHSVVSVAGDFARIDLPGPFDVVGYLGGFGAGSDDDQRFLLRQISRWVGFETCVLVEVMAPWFWARKDPRVSDQGRPWAFDADACRVEVRMAPLWDDGPGVALSLRCYSPADLRLLLEGTGLVLDAIEPYTSEGYEPAPRLEDAKLYLARLVPGL